MRSDLAKDLAKMPYNGSLNELKMKYGDGLETKSHVKRLNIMI